MTDQDSFFRRAEQLLDRLEPLLPASAGSFVLPDSPTGCWRQRGRERGLAPVHHPGKVHLDDLQCIERQKSALYDNTRQFLAGLPANNALLWGPRGTGKSSLIKAVFNHFRHDGLKLIELDSDWLHDLPDLCDALHNQSGHYVLFCDDLSFQSGDPAYKAMKVIMDGSVSRPPDHVLIYATSNRRHLVPESMSENRDSHVIGGELHLSESLEEKLSLSERFGLWLAFHPFSQEQYLQVVHYWLTQLGVPAPDREGVDRPALQWALEHGSRSGRSANLFARHWAGKTGLARL